MINMISGLDKRPRVSGPGKVFLNLAKGLDKIGYPYVVNHPLDSCRRLWIHDSPAALYEMRGSTARKVLGPNLYVMPEELPFGIDLREALYLHPCSWAKQVWEHVGFAACPIRAWPVGIDIEAFTPARKHPRSGTVLVYHKRRDARELERILDVLARTSLKSVLFRYGSYQQEDYLEALREVSFVIWHGCHETQGMALQEALACDVPILVCDAPRLSQSLMPKVRGVPAYSKELDVIPVTSAPYFDSTCGVKITNLAELDSAIDIVLSRLPTFRPRDFVRENLSLEGQARKFVALWEYWGMTFDEGLRERPSRQAKWRPSLWARLRWKIERRLREVLRLRRHVVGS